MKPTKIGNVLREARLDACMSLHDVQKTIGMASNQLSRLELRGNLKYVAFTTVAKLARLYRVSLDELASEILQ